MHLLQIRIVALPSFSPSRMYFFFKGAPRWSVRRSARAWVIAVLKNNADIAFFYNTRIVPPKAAHSTDLLSF